MTIQVLQPRTPSVLLRGDLIETSNLSNGSSRSQTDNALPTFESLKLIHLLIEHHAQHSPHSAALQEGEHVLTYQNLNSTANAVSRQLGSVAGSIIAIFLPRSSNLIITLLAVLKAGASYVLLSTDSPMDRNQYIINDTRASLVIVENETERLFDCAEQKSISTLVSISKTLDERYLTNPNAYQDSSTLAYIIYTSGTTGKPKGVMLSHSAAYNGIIALPALEAPLRQLLCHSPNFSAAQRTILGTLCRGGLLCLASKDNITLHLNNTIHQMGISSLEITPSMLKLLDPEALSPAVKKITLGGEAVGPALVEAWAGKVELVSSYGLSECTQLNMRHRLYTNRSPRLIGSPTDSTTYHILEVGALSHVPVGVAGELCLGGQQLADGYLNLPGKTNEVFIPNPFGQGRLYRTGDMALINEDGSIELIGRIDQQMKIDGQRVEPNESNSVIEIQPGVLQSCVVPAFVFNRTALVAVVVTKSSDQDWTSLVRQIRSVLQSQLPSYAIPRFWVEEADLPLNVSGKIDVAGLVRAVESMDPDRLLIPSGTPANMSSGEGDFFESRIAALIASTLSMSLTSISLGSSFQELGGSSLDAIVVASNLRKIDIHVSVADILQSDSIRIIASSRTDPGTQSAFPPVPFSLLPKDTAVESSAEDAYPVTPLQEGILADSILGNVDYIYRRIYKLQGISPALLRSALEQVVARSSILRTTFSPWKRSFMQVVHSRASLPWTTVSNTSLQAYLQDPSGNAMNLNEPLVRAAVLNNEWLILEMHHALFDFWSSQFIVEDAISIMTGQSTIPRLQFNSYVAYQQLRHDAAAKQFWESYLGSSPMTVLDLNQVGGVGTSLDHFVSTHDIGTGLLDFSQSHSVTIGAALHSVWALTLSSFLNSTDVTFATAFSGRDADVNGILSLDGPTLCTVPMRVQVDPKVSSLEFSKATQKNLWGLTQYAHSGMRNALAASSTKPTSFNTMVNFLVKLPGLTASSPLVPILVHSDNFTQYITIEVSETNPTSAKLLVPTSGEPAIAKSLLETFSRIVKLLAEQPNETVGNLLKAPKVQLDDVPVYAPSHTSFCLAHAAMESFAALNPSKIAIRTTSGRKLTYGELNYKANSFASWLLARGTQHQEMIPLYMDKSPETLISIFGILKAGASFTPLDPMNPHDRNAFIIQDVRAVRIISDRKHSSACAAFGIDVIVPEDLNLNSMGDKNHTIAGLNPSSIIYAIYTSGSTGLPKGVIVSHSAVSASTHGMIEATKVTSAWNALWVLNYVFDASYYDVFTLFSAGATLCLAPQDELLSNLANHINELGIEQVMLTPTITKLISGGPAQVPGLKVLNVCGEKIDVNILKWAEAVDVYNGYGPTEATILMTVSHVTPNSSLNSIGFPLKHVDAVILHQEGTNLDRVEHGKVGELCVKGHHLAVGYLNRPEITSQSFIRDVDGELLYRTGDLARWAEDGSLECLGRKDYQIKLNGFRIELGESKYYLGSESPQNDVRNILLTFCDLVENAILHTGEVDAAIVSVAEIHGKPQLVAFVIFSGDHQPGPTSPLPASDRLERVSLLLPQLTTISHYMLPTLFLPFNCLPTLPSGKANRKALIALVSKMSKAEITEYIPLQEVGEFKDISTEEERIMRQAWAAVLDEEEEQIGANSVFLSLGGDSISAINVVSTCRQLGYTISVSHVLANPTLSEQAKHLKTEEKKMIQTNVKYEVPRSILTALDKSAINYAQDIELILPCGAGQTEFLIQGKKKQQFWNLTACRELPTDFDLQQWKDVTTKLTERNMILRTMYYKVNPNDDASWYQIVFREPVLNFEYIFYENESEKLQYMENLRDSLFTFGKPNIKYQVLHSLSDGTRTLCIKVDHASYDGSLLRIFDDQFKAIARGETELPPVNDFKHFIDWSHNGDRNLALSYWNNSLSTYNPQHKLPLQPIANRLKFEGIDKDVDSIATLFGVTTSTIFQAAYSIAVGHLSGTYDVLIDNLLTGRNADVEDPQLLNGTCANFLPSRTILDDATTIENFLKEVQADFWAGTENGIVGLNDIYTHLAKDRSVHSAKLLYCFQPFEPAPKTNNPDHMRWIVMAQSKVFMSINYALMLEVQKTMGGHRLKLQWDANALNDEQVVKFAELMGTILEQMALNRYGTLEVLTCIETPLASIWKS